MNDYLLADWLLEKAMEVVAGLRAANDDAKYGLLEAAYNHIAAARSDLDADLK